MRIAKLISLFVLAGLLSAYVCAQTGTSSLRGTITDPNGAVVPGADVSLSNPATGFTRTVKSNGQGVYQILEVPPATYSVKAQAAGFAAIKQDNVPLMVNTPATLDFTLRVAGGETLVEVTGAAPIVNTTDASLGHAFNSDQISYLPFEGREATSILSLQPGVAFTGNSTSINPNTDSRSGSVNGARSDQTNVTLDGVDNNDQTLGVAFTGALRATLDSLQEFRVTTSNANADAGRSSGGQVALVTKSGTNAFHGTAYEYYRPPFGAANDWFNKNAELGATPPLPNTPPKLLRNTFGATFGGPIKKDRLFFFLAYEGQRTRENLQATRIVPSAGLRNGFMTYPCSDDPTCPAGGTFTLTPADLVKMDPNCASIGSCPLGPGANPAVMKLFQQYPLPNTNSLGDGFDFTGLTFSSPLPAKLDTYVAKIDYNITKNGNHRAFVRVGQMNDHEASRLNTSATSVTGSGGSQFLGQPAGATHLNNSKGLIAGYTAVLRDTLLNNFRYGYIRQGFVDLGLQSQHYVHFRGLDDLTAETPTTHNRVPVHNFVDDITWTKGEHTLQFGANLRVINDIRDSNGTSFFTASSNSFWLAGSCIATCGVSFDPGSFGFPAVNSDFGSSYDFAMSALAGLIPEVSSNYNLTKTLSALPEGTAVTRHFRSHELEFYGQDTYRLKPNLTVTYGLRYTLLQPPYETTGTQVSPDVSLNDWFTKRGQAMRQGLAYEPLVSFNLSGQANGKKPYWGWDYKDFAPRISLAYSPKGEGGLSKLLWGGSGKTSIRVGYGMYYDHFGEGIVNSFDALGSFGLTTAITNPAGVQTVDGSARFTDVNTIPTTSHSTTGLCPTAPCPIVEAAPSGSFPVTPPAGLANGGYAITWGLDDRLKTPYSHLVDLSITRELPKGFVFEANYVGRFARRLLQESDLAMPADLVDPKSGMDYFTAASLLAKQYYAGVPIQNVKPIPYWQNVYPAAAGPSATQLGAECSKQGTSCSGLTNGPLPANVTATQAMYDVFAYNQGNETTALETIDVPGLISATGCYPACATINGQQTPFAFYSPQWSSLYAWRSDGNSAYNAGQFSLRRRMAGGLQFDLNYTYSRSIDQGSNAERINQFQGGGFASQVINAWSPKQLRAVSDFDATHQINANGVYQLPFGRGKHFGSGMGRALDAIVGGWTVSGLWRWSTGYPFSVGTGFGWATNFELESQAVMNGKRPDTGTFFVNGLPNVFPDPTSAIKQFRPSFPGESGQRNNFRGPGTFSIDSAVSKSWKITEQQSIRFSTEAFNITNTPRFDVGTMQFNGNVLLANSTQFGNFSSTLSNPRVLEFSLRYSF